jgi:hypothetical protein
MSVRASVRAPVVLLRGHVGGGAEDRAGEGHRRDEALDGGARAEVRALAGLALAGAAGEAEVEDADAAVVADHDVVGLEVAVDEADGVGGGEAVAGLGEHAEDLGAGPRLLVEPAAQRDAGDELHRDVDLAVGGGADVVDADDVGVREAGEGLGLAQQAALALGVAGAVAQDLDRDLAIEGLVEGGVDDAHAAAAELAQDGVAADAGLFGVVVLGDLRDHRGADQRRVGDLVPRELPRGVPPGQERLFEVPGRLARHVGASLPHLRSTVGASGRGAGPRLHGL